MLFAYMPSVVPFPDSCATGDASETPFSVATTIPTDFFLHGDQKPTQYR